MFFPKTGLNFWSRFFFFFFFIWQIFWRQHHHFTGGLFVVLMFVSLSPGTLDLIHRRDGEGGRDVSRNSRDLRCGGHLGGGGGHCGREVGESCKKIKSVHCAHCHWYIFDSTMKRFKWIIGEMPIDKKLHPFTQKFFSCELNRFDQLASTSKAYWWSEDLPKLSD